MSDAPLESEQAKRILAERAAKFALEKTEITTFTHSSLLVFNIGKEQKYAIDFSAIERVIPDQNLRPVPGVNPLFSGLIYHNAVFWPVINLRVMFGCKQLATENNYILLYDEPYHYALAIGHVIEQITYDKSQDLTQLSRDDSIQHSYLLGIYQSEIAVIDISTILKVLRSSNLELTGEK